MPERHAARPAVRWRTRTRNKKRLTLRQRPRTPSATQHSEFPRLAAQGSPQRCRWEKMPPGPPQPLSVTPAQELAARPQALRRARRCTESRASRPRAPLHAADREFVHRQGQRASPWPQHGNWSTAASIWYTNSVGPHTATFPMTYYPRSSTDGDAGRPVVRAAGFRHATPLSPLRHKAPFSLRWSNSPQGHANVPGDRLRPTLDTLATSCKAFTSLALKTRFWYERQTS